MSNRYDPWHMRLAIQKAVALYAEQGRASIGHLTEYQIEALIYAAAFAGFGILPEKGPSQ